VRILFSEPEPYLPTVSSLLVQPGAKLLARDVFKLDHLTYSYHLHAFSAAVSHHFLELVLENHGRCGLWRECVFDT
jgi:hypothetical protein